MKSIRVLAIVCIPALLAWNSIGNWSTEKQKGYTIQYTNADKANKNNYVRLVNNGIKTVQSFFNSAYKNEFTVFVYPDRKGLDSTWQKDWNMPAFKSECWMVASGIATKLDMISPKMWDKESCEHKYADSVKTQQLITHELVHVYHGQQNPSPDFSNVTGIDWFVEGLAVYASGQCDAARMAQVKKAIIENKTPAGLDKFWTGDYKYGLSGSVVMYIDKNYGREKLIGLLKLTNITDVLAALHTTEIELLSNWKEFVLKK